jgi:hypothetical protein
MFASQVHAVIAAGLENPALLARWRQEPNLLRKCGVDPEGVDLDALWKFAGLTTKVRHNGLRGDLPLTFRLLNVAGLEIEVFASYASFQANEGRGYAPTAEARSRELSMFLEHWLDFDKREHALLWDLIRHEVTLARLRKTCHNSDEATVDQAPVPRRPRSNSIPHLCGEVVLHELQSDPRVAEVILRQKRPRLDQVPLATFYSCYWLRNAEELFTLELDELGFYLLSLIDGEKSLADLACMITGSRRPSRELLNAFAELATTGVVGFS